MRSSLGLTCHIPHPDHACHDCRSNRAAPTISGSSCQLKAPQHQQQSRDHRHPAMDLCWPDQPGSLWTVRLWFERASATSAGSLAAPGAVQCIQQQAWMSGTLPLELGLLQQLQVLDLSNMALNGQLPAGLCDLTAGICCSSGCGSCQTTGSCGAGSTGAAVGGSWERPPEATELVQRQHLL